MKMQWIFCVALALVCQVMEAKLSRSYYDVLGVPRKFSDFELKKRYRQLAKEFHPDKIEDEKLKEEAANQFMVIAKSYEVLSDPELRKKYDELVKAGIYDYNEDEYEEWDARRNGWRSKAEVEWMEGFALNTVVLSIVLCCGGGFYYQYKEKEDKARLAAANHQSFISKLEKQRPTTQKDVEKKALSKSQLLIKQSAYQKALKVYHKTLKKALRNQLENHGLWFATTFTSAQISALCVGLNQDDLVKYTVALCDAAGVNLPSPPPSDDPEPSIDKSAPLSYRQLLKALKARSEELESSS